MNTEKKRFSKRSWIPPINGHNYTRFFSTTYNFQTTLTGWRKKIAQHALDQLPTPAKLLDIGCGTGFLLNLAIQRGFEGYGVDPSSGMLKEALTHYSFPKDHLIQADAHNIPLPSESFDIITASGSLVYVTEIEKACSEISRLLKKGGHLRIIDHALPFEKSWTTPFITIFSQLSGDILHDYPAIFGTHFKLIEKKTLGRGGYLQRFDFIKI